MFINDDNDKKFSPEIKGRHFETSKKIRQILFWKFQKFLIANFHSRK